MGECCLNNKVSGQNDVITMHSVVHVNGDQISHLRVRLGRYKLLVPEAISGGQTTLIRVRDVWQTFLNVVLAFFFFFLPILMQSFGQLLKLKKTFSSLELETLPRNDQIKKELFPQHTPSQKQTKMLFMNLIQ